MANITTLDLGVITPIPKGEYNPATDYERLNFVTFNGSSWIRTDKEPYVVGSIPQTGSLYWQLMAKKGDAGADVAVVTPPLITGSNDAVIGFNTNYSLSSTSMLVGNNIASFDYRLGSGDTNTVTATSNGADIQVAVPQNTPVGTKIPLFVTAYDNKGYSNYNEKQLTSITAKIDSPIIININEGSTDVLPNVTIQVGSFIVSPSGFDTPNNFTYWFKKQSDNTVIETKTITISASGGVFKPTIELPINTALYLECKWVGSKIESSIKRVNFTTINAYINPPLISGVSDGQIGVALKPTFSIGSFDVVPNGYDSPKNLLYTISKTSDNTVVETNSIVISSVGGSFKPVNDLPLNTPLKITAKWIGNKLISAETIVNFTTLSARIDTPVFVAPVGDSKVYNSKVTAIISEPSVIGDTHNTTTWRLKRSDNNSVLQEAVDSSDKLTHVFTNVNVSADIVCYVEAIANGQFVSSSVGTSSTFTVTVSRHGQFMYGDDGTAKAIIIGNPDGTPFDIMGVNKWLGVDLSKTRTTAKFGTFGKDTPLPNPDIVGDKLDASSTDHNSRGNYVSPQTTDQQMNEAFVQETGNSKSNSDTWMTYEGTTDSKSISGVPAVRHCRSIIVDGKPMDCPSQHALMRVYKLREFIDANDPTANSYPANKLTTSWGSGTTVIWSSTEYGSDSVFFVNRYGAASGCTFKYGTYGVVAVVEIEA